MQRMNDLASIEAKQRVAAAVTAIEKKTSAEIVVMMRPDSGSYRQADLVAGAIAAFAYLCVFLYAPEPFDFTYFPLEQAASFGIAAFACSRLPGLRRLLTGKKVLARNALVAAKATFVDRGISKTRSRTGVLAYLSRFERETVVVLDVGLDVARLGEPMVQARDALQAAGRRGDLDALVKALETMGARLAEVYPVEDDDADELPNEVAA
jgi:putative membrane protein